MQFQVSCIWFTYIFHLSTCFKIIVSYSHGRMKAGMVVEMKHTREGGRQYPSNCTILLIDTPPLSPTLLSTPCTVDLIFIINV